MKKQNNYNRILIFEIIIFAIVSYLACQYIIWSLMFTYGSSLFSSFDFYPITNTYFMPNLISLIGVALNTFLTVQFASLIGYSRIRDIYMKILLGEIIFTALILNFVVLPIWLDTINKL